jgi:hypothetical protein
MKDRRLDAPEIKNNHCGTIKPTSIVAENIFEDQETAFINARFGDNPQFPLKPECSPPPDTCGAHGDKGTTDEVAHRGYIKAEQR